MTQREIPMFYELQKIQPVEPEYIALCRDMTDAVLLCIQSSQIKYTRASLADLLGLDKSRFTKILKRKGYNFPLDELVTLMKVCGNYAPLQYMLKQLGLSGEAMEMIAKLAA